MPTSSYTFQILIEGKEAIASAKRIRAELERELSQIDLRRQMADVGTEAQTTATRMAQMQRELHGATRESGRLEVDLRDASDETRTLVSQLLQSGASAEQLEQALRGGAPAVQATRDEVRGLGGDLRSALAQARRETADLRTIAAAGGRIGRGMMTTGAAIVGPLALAGRSYLEFARDADRAARQLKLNAELTDALKDETLELSARMGLFTPEEISQGLYTWASAIGAVAESQEDLDALLQDSTEIQKLAAMNQEQLGTTTAFVAATLGEFRMDTSQVNRVVEIFNYTADRTQATVSDLGDSFRYLGPMAADLGEDIEGVAAAMGVAADAGIKGSMSGRALRQLFIRLVKPTDEMNEAFDEALGLSGELGQTWEGIVFPEGKFIGLANFIDLVAAATEDMTDQERQALLAQLATANELPVLTALVSKQIEARKKGINVLRAEEKIMRGVIDAEVRKYGEWKEATEGITVSLESAHDSWEREWEMYEKGDTARADRMQQRWNEAWIRVGKAAVEVGLPMVEKLGEALEDISQFVEDHPEMIDVAIKGGGALLVGGAAIKSLATAVRLYADARMLLAGVGGLGALGKGLTTGLVGVTGTLGAVAALLGVGMYAAKEAGVPEWTQAQMAFKGETYEEYVAAMRRTAQHPVKILTEAQWEAIKAGEDYRDVLGQVEDKVEETGEELRDWNVELTRARRGAQGLGSDLAQLPEAAGTGLAAFTEAQLKAINEWEDFLRRRTDLLEEHNQELAEMQEDFLAEEAQHYDDYLKERADLIAELQTITEDPLWQMTEEVQESLAEQLKAIEEHNKEVEEAAEDHQRKLRDLQEGHDDKMMDIEAARDAKGILDERTRYAREVRNAEEQQRDLLDELKDGLDETLEEEQESMKELREERREDLEAQLKELDEQYDEEARMRQEDFDKRYAEQEQQNIREFEQLERAHVRKLASIMEWEEEVCDELRRQYIGREADLSAHLQAMEAMYREMYDLAGEPVPVPEMMTPEQYRQWHEEIRGHQMGGYAGLGLYRLGEAGKEFVLSSPTTRAMERAIGHLTQTKMMSMAAGGGRRDRLDIGIHVTADQHFSPEFAARIEAGVLENVVSLATQVAGAKPSAHRIH
jgi:TP901 family phage tail tape measure protein